MRPGDPPSSASDSLAASGGDHTSVSQDYTATDEPSAKNSGVTSSIAPPLTAADRGPRGGDLPYAYIDPRWLRSYLPTVNARAKHLTRNNRHAKTAALNVPTDIVGSGIHPTLPEEQATIWHKWASRRRRINTSKRLTWQGLQWLIVRSVMVTGEAFIVMRRRRMNDSAGLIPLSIEIFDADGLSDAPARGMRARATFDQGREIGPNGRVLAWHFRIDAGFRDRYLRVPASDVVHVYDPDDCAGRRGISWFSPVVIDLSELSGYQDSTAVKQHLASKLTVITSDPSMFTQMMKPGDPIPDLDPGNIITVEPGRTVESFQPPANRDYRDFVKVNRDEIAMCLGAVPGGFIRRLSRHELDGSASELPQALDAQCWTPRTLVTPRTGRRLRLGSVGDGRAFVRLAGCG